MDSKEEVLGLDADIVDDKLTLIAKDEAKFEVERKVAVQSELIKTITEGGMFLSAFGGMSVDSSEKNIPLPNVSGKILTKVIEYLKYHLGNPAKEIERPLKSANMREVVAEWDADFVEIDDETLFDLILAANYMDVKPLLDLTCAKVASYMKGKTAEEIRKRFNIENDLTPEYSCICDCIVIFREEAAIRLENKWAEES